mmetsp:Transcript_29694/g.83712  ORF Transcript_29694/g.83712 Transcript_29694/m.83712 type:complete len:236 (-) Transcript_29694:248-955(-)
MPDLRVATSGAAQLRQAPARRSERDMAQCQARRYAIKYDPPTIILEYETPANEKRLRSVKVQDVHQDADIDDLTKKVIRSFPRKLDRKSVRFEQVQRLVEKLVKAQPDPTTIPGPSKRAAVGDLQPLRTPTRDSSQGAPAVAAKPLARNGADSFGMSVDSIADAETDLCKLSTEELQAVKATMEVDFKKNLITKDDPEFEYDVQKEFQPTEDNDWDEEDEFEGSQNDSDDFEWPT